MLKALARYVLLLGVVVGLSTQGVASASTPCSTMPSTQVGAMAGMPDCAAMAEMDNGKAPAKEAPAKEMPPGCMAMAGCVAVVAFEVPIFAVEAPPPVVGTAILSSIRVFSGRDIAPEPEPPTLLG